VGTWHKAVFWKTAQQERIRLVFSAILPIYIVQYNVSYLVSYLSNFLLDTLVQKV
jgi:hypothetical protein